jgi:hypothetical protein
MGWRVVTGLLIDTGNVLATYILGQSMVAGKKTYFQIQQMHKCTGGRKVRHEFPNNVYIRMPNQVCGSGFAFFWKLDPYPDLHLSESQRRWIRIRLKVKM